MKHVQPFANEAKAKAMIVLVGPVPVRGSGKLEGAWELLGSGVVACSGSFAQTRLQK